MKNNSSLGLYVHIPFCSRICHYCDFAKTANYSDKHIKRYLEILELQLDAWTSSHVCNQKFTSVFFGGGTPGVLTKQYESLMEKILAATEQSAEITLESNPSNVTLDNLQIWRDLGFNRLSIGIQSFDPQGLKVLTRDHSPELGIEAIKLASKYFPKSNGDLIYGWPGQNEQSWQNDIKLMADSGVNHMSLYALTFEGQTPFARANRRGIMSAAEDEVLVSRYDVACSSLKKYGFRHEEISNWSLGSSTCDHNWLYWRGEHFVGIGAGAHGFVDDGSLIGMRYGYQGELRSFLRFFDNDPSSGKSHGQILSSQNLYEKCRSAVEHTGGIVDDERDLWSWAQEYVGCALRTEEGIDLNVLRNAGFSFQANAIVAKGIDEKLLIINADRLIAIEQEWFRETAWSVQICDSLGLNVR